MTTTEERIAAILRDIFRVRPDEVGPDVTFGELGFDSIATVELVLALNDEFGTALTDDVLTDSTTLAEAAGLITGREVVSG